MTDPNLLRGDCERCIGLCCVVLGFDRGPQFSFDKPAGETCRHLGADHRCRIHDRLLQRGMVGCIRFDCLGAGQLVTAMFQGLVPRDSAAIGRAISFTFAQVRDIQAWRCLLRGIESDEAARLESSLAVATESYPALLRFDLGAARRAASAIVRAAGRPP